MPIYEYFCHQCQQSEEVIQKVDEEAPAECTHCHARGTLKKAVTRSAFHLKGGGWYKDLYSSTKPDSSDSKTSSSKPEETKKETTTKSDKKDT